MAGGCGWVVPRPSATLFARAPHSRIATRKTARGDRSMEFGASIFFTDYSISPAELAVAMEERGFDSVWAAEHSHIPVPRRTRADTDPGKRHYDVMDPLGALTAA